MPTVNQTLDKARGDLGVHETNGNNRTSVGEWFGWNGVAWCAQAVSKWLITSGFDIKKNAGAHELAAYLYRTKKWERVVPSNIKGGDVVLFTWSHIGICEARQSSSAVITIEGNNNDACRRVTRANSTIAYGVRPPYAAAPVVVTPPATTPKPSGAREARLIKDTQGWNMTLGTKRSMLRKGGVVTYLGNPVTKNGNKYVQVSCGGKSSWIRYDNMRWI
jgi:hypothetical protein